MCIIVHGIFKFFSPWGSKEPAFAWPSVSVLGASFFKLPNTRSNSKSWSNIDRLFIRFVILDSFAKNSKLWHMINKITYVAFIVLLLNRGGCSASKGKSNIFQGSPCGSCYWNGKPKEASYQKKPISPVRDWKKGVIYRPPIKHQRV